MVYTCTIPNYLPYKTNDNDEGFTIMATDCTLNYY